MAPNRGSGEMTLLEALRTDRGLTVQRLEEITGVNHKTIVRYEKAQTVNPLSTPLEKLAAFYRVRASELLADMRRFARERGEREEAQIAADIERSSGALADAA
jgi:transcriptional regulator with XRE-family HTH domain